MDINSYIASGIIEMYVMGLCSAEEKTELEKLRRQHPALNDAVVKYEKELEEKMQKNSTLPSPETDERILKSLNALQTPVVEMTGVQQKVRNLGWLKPAAAASFVLLAVSVFFNYSLNDKNRKLKRDLEAASNIPQTLPLADYNIMKNPTITPVALYGVGTHAICRCTMFWDKKTGKLYIMIHHLPQSSNTSDYQLWAMVDGKPVSVGIIQDEIRGRFIEMGNVPAGATAFTVTLEKAGGNSAPTEEETYLAGRI
jgi:anti-sigma-K factor RskA